MKTLVEFLKESINEARFELPEWYVEKVKKEASKLYAAFKDTKAGKGKFAKFAEAASLIGFLVDIVVEDWPELMKDNGPDFEGQDMLDDSLDNDLIENWMCSDEVIDKEHEDEDYDSDSIVDSYKKLGGWEAWYKLATGQNWN